jgi:hypothetical protein
VFAVPHIFAAGFARRSIFRLSRIPQLCVLSLTIAVGLASTVHVPLASAQRARASRNQRTNDPMPPKTAAPVAAAPVTPEPPVAPPPIAVTVEQTPPQLPVISWDGVQLTIDAENSTLSDIMLGIRGRTGASIEMPPSASRERVAVHLGPAPIREVLSSLLYGSDFDYIVQGSDTDPNGLRRVILTTRGGKDDDTVVAGGAEKVPGMRLMPGYVAPGKHDFEVSQKIGDDDAASASASESVQSAPEAGTTTADAASANPQPPADGGTQTPAVDSADVTMPIGGESPGGNRTTASTSLDQSGSGDASSMSQMQQNLQHMYQQRQKIQAQQNQSALPPTH